MKTKSFDEIVTKISSVRFTEKFDLVVGIARGGIVPAFLLSSLLKTDLAVLWLSFRGEDNRIVHKSPRLMRSIDFDFKNKKILLVDDRPVTGQTFRAARGSLQGAALVKTFAVNGKADYSLYDEECFLFPWKMEGKRKEQRKEI
jgi:uncharacterized protein